MTVVVPDFLGASVCDADGLRLQTAGGLGPAGPLRHPRFFSGSLVQPEQGAQGLLAVAAVARSRYYVPMTAARRAAILDPVVTSDGAALRFESFSGCAGVYARLDVLPEGLDGDVLERGTTNVDVGPALQAALARVGGSAPLHLAVGPDELAVTTLSDAVVERKVPLPQRWLRGFAEAPVALAGMALRAEVDAGEARRFLRALPRGSRRDVLWVVPSGRSLRLTSRPVPGAVCLAGPQRLEHLHGLLRTASALRVYGPDVDGRPAASAWEVVLPGARLVLTVSPDLDRGFSGEGGVLSALADGAVADADAVGEALQWLPAMSLQQVSVAAALPEDRALAALHALGTAGRVGHEVSTGRWFSRQLPYEVDDAGRLNPRLVAARRLVSEGRLTRRGEVAVVDRGDHVQHVHLPAPVSCTCTWWAAHAGSRGPCSHVLAARLLGWA